MYSTIEIAEMYHALTGSNARPILTPAELWEGKPLASIDARFPMFDLDLPVAQQAVTRG